MRLISLVVLAVSSRAVADPATELTDRLQGLLWKDSHDEVAHPLPRVILDETAPRFDPKGRGIGSGLFALHRPAPIVVGVAIDGKSAWTAANLGAPLPEPEKQEVDAHVTALFEGPAPWTPVMTHLGGNAASKTKGRPPVMPNRADPTAAEAVKRFKATLGDPAAFARSISDRKDVVLFGSDPAERYVGGATVRATLATWNLAFAVRDGVAAGVTASKTVAWVAAYVDARKAGKPIAVYLVSAVYEKHGASWDIVMLQFSNPAAE